MDLNNEEATIAEERASQLPAFGADILYDPIRALCTKRAISVDIDATIGDAVIAMQERRVGSVLVVEGDALRGIVTERDVTMNVAGKERSYLERSVREVMTPDPETLRAGDSLIHLMNKMHVGGFRHVTVVDENGRPEYVLSLRAVLGHLIDLVGARVLNMPADPFRGERREGSG